MGIDRAALKAEIDGCIASQRTLDAHLGSIVDLDPTQPSQLAGWTIGHVLTHLARNADGHRNVLAGQPQYRDGAARDAEIDAGATRSWASLVGDVAQSSALLAEAWLASLDDITEVWSGTASMMSGVRPMTMLPLLRWREVEVHRVDLGLGYEAHEIDRHYLRRDLRVCEMLWRARRPIGLTPLPAQVLAAAPHERLFWFLGRVEIEGVDRVD